MKKWIIALLVLTLAIYLLFPSVLHWTGYRTTRVMIYNGSTSLAKYTLNGEELELAPASAEVYRSSRFTNELRHHSGQDDLTVTFGPGQHLINLGTAKLHLRELYYRWDNKKGAFSPHPVERPKDRLLYDASLGKGLHTLDTCWDCWLLLPPDERPYRYLTPENKDRRIMVSSKM
jgi:hypothetical protein